MRSLVVLGALVASATACTTEDIVVATLPPAAPDAGGPPAQPPALVRCVDPVDCRPDELCARPACDVLAGVCEPRPAICPPIAEPVCGCDGITYFNDCLRRAAGVPASTPGECSVTALRCGQGAPPCPGNAWCAVLLGPGASCTEIAGRCWALPPECPPPSTPDRWIPCGEPGPCVDTCLAIRLGRPSVRAARCP